MEEILVKSKEKETKVDYVIVYAEIDCLYEEILQQDEAITREAVGNLE